jgi:hypothetical protein|tara:strand:- start:172 stop:948 length:777 start_codon:yes stop_codon:yes gene_type:complete
MKRTATTTSMMIVLVLGSNLFAQGLDPKAMTYYGGISINSITTSEFQNFHLSDWEDYGLGGSEGRVSIPLGDKDPAGTNLSFLGGGISPLSDNLNAIVEFQIGLGDISYTALYVGVTYNLINGESFKLGITPKAGYTLATADFGEIELISGYTPPVIIPEGTFTNGDKLTMDMTGVGVQIGITPSIKINDQIGILVQAGYELSFASDPVIMVNDEIEIPMTATGVVKADGSGTQAGLNPTAETGGMCFQFGISYKLGD